MKKEAKSIITYVRLTPTELALIQGAANQFGSNFSAFVREAALDVAKHQFVSKD
jgi:uncharacterized protein (DUF1778 family)